MEQLDTKQAGKGPDDLKDWYKTACDGVGAAYFANAMHMCYTQPKAEDLPCVWSPDQSPSMTPSEDMSPDVVQARSAFLQLTNLYNWQGLSSKDPELLSCYLVKDVPQTGVPSVAYFEKKTMMGFAYVQCTGERGDYQVNEVVLAMKSCNGDPWGSGNKACTPFLFADVNMFLEDLKLLDNLTSLFLVNLGFGVAGSKFEPPSALYSLTGLTNLVMTGNKLKSLPGTFGSLTKLLWLDISNNEFTEFPTVLGEVPKLYSLDMSSNKIVTLPAAVKEMKELVYLDLSNNQIEALPIGQLNHENAKLIDLRMRNNKLTSISAELGEIMTLENVDFGYNLLTVLPNAIRGWTGLKSLDVSNNRLGSIPAAIGELDDLEVLKFKGNMVNEIPKEIGSMENLMELDGSYNDILVVPTQIGRLDENLKILNLKSNKIPQLPREVKALTNLEELNLDSNHLDKVWSLAQMTKLEYAYISNNQLECLPDLPPGKTWTDPGPKSGNFQADDVNKLRSCSTPTPTKEPTPQPTKDPSGAVSMRESSILVIGFSLLVASIALLQ